MVNANDLSRSSTVLEQNSTLIAVIELSLSSWLVAGIVPGLARHPLKKLAADPEALLLLLHRRREEAAKYGRAIARIANALSFWKRRKRQASWIIPRRILISLKSSVRGCGELCLRAALTTSPHSPVAACGRLRGGIGGN